MMFLRVEGGFEEKQRRRMLILSMVAIDRMRSAMRLTLRKMLILRCKLVRKVEGKRKRLIWSKKEAKAREKGSKWSKRVERKIEKIESAVVREMIMKKVKKWAKNLEKGNKQ